MLLRPHSDQESVLKLSGSRQSGHQQVMLPCVDDILCKISGLRGVNGFTFFVTPPPTLCSYDNQGGRQNGHWHLSE